jgi:hypothetical protein
VGITKNSEYCDNAIDVWTRRDIEKIQTAKENNLNYIAYYPKSRNIESEIKNINKLIEDFKYDSSEKQK